MRELAGEGVVAGVKDSSGNVEAQRMLAEATADIEGFRRYTGSEFAIDGLLLGGFHGAVPGLANVFAPWHVELAARATAGDWKGAAEIQGRIVAFFKLYQHPMPGGSFSAAVIASLKEALVQQGGHRIFDDRVAVRAGRRRDARRTCGKRWRRPRSGGRDDTPDRRRRSHGRDPGTGGLRRRRDRGPARRGARRRTGGHRRRAGDRGAPQRRPAAMVRADPRGGGREPAGPRGGHPDQPHRRGQPGPQLPRPRRRHGHRADRGCPGAARHPQRGPAHRPALGGTQLRDAVLRRLQRSDRRTGGARVRRAAASGRTTSSIRGAA